MRTKNKKESKKAIIKNRQSSPEDFLFGFLILCSIIFSAFCLGGPKQISDALPNVVELKARSATDKNIQKMVVGYPMRNMIPFIGKQDDKVAAFLVAIAKKESNWGKHTPKKNGKECFNYWGYRGPENPTRSGYSCFDSPKQAVRVVGKRIRNLIAKKIDTPQEMVMWKCGAACAGNDSSSANKWVKDVGFYYNSLYE
jgi:hypothetical protein